MLIQGAEDNVGLLDMWIGQVRNWEIMRNHAEPIFLVSHIFF